MQLPSECSFDTVIEGILAASYSWPVTPEPDHWINRMFDRLDEMLARLQRHCPKCGGDLYRVFSFWDKIALYFPLPHTLYAKHTCDRCHRRFRSYRTLTDVFLEAAWIGALLYLGEFRLLALACTITWLVVNGVMDKNVSRGMSDTLCAGLLTGILWALALVFGNKHIGQFFHDHTVLVFVPFVLVLFFPVGIVLVLDRYTNFNLEEIDGENSMMPHNHENDSQQHHK